MTAIVHTENHAADGECCCPNIGTPGDCPHCTLGAIDLPPTLYDPASIPCPWCESDAYADGFPGLRIAGSDRWLLPPGSGS